MARRVFYSFHYLPDNKKMLANIMIGNQNFAVVA